MLLIEQSIATGTPLAGAALDAAKAFNSMDWNIILRMAKLAGMPAAIVDTCAAFVANLRRRFKYMSSVGEAWLGTNGFLQGCALSIIFMNLHAALWVALLAERHPDAGTSTFLDDKSLAEHSIQAAVITTAELDGDVGHCTNMKKPPLLPLQSFSVISCRLCFLSLNLVKRLFAETCRSKQESCCC